MLSLTIGNLHSFWKSDFHGSQHGHCSLIQSAYCSFYNKVYLRLLIIINDYEYILAKAKIKCKKNISVYKNLIIDSENMLIYTKKKENEKMIRYYKLFDLIMKKGMKKTDLLEIISSPTLAKLSKGEVVRTDIIDKICLYLKCQPSDIMEVYEVVTYTDKNGNEQTKEVPANQETLDAVKEMLNNPMFNMVMGMFENAAQTSEEKASVEQAKEVFKEFLPEKDGN